MVSARSRNFSQLLFEFAREENFSFDSVGLDRNFHSQIFFRSEENIRDKKLIDFGGEENFSGSENCECETDVEKFRREIFSEPRLPRRKNSASKKRQWAISAEKHRKILEMLRGGAGIREVARTVGVGMRTVYRRRDLVEQEIAEAIAEEDGSGEAVEFVTLGRGVRACPVHGPVTVWPCVACAAMAAKHGEQAKGGTLRVGRG